MISDRDLVKSLQSVVCPACGGKKKRGHTFCGRDYFRLTHDMREALYNRLGHGYAEAVADAMEHLGAVDFSIPKT
jgi:hypothetical protein